ncbi:MAP65/ASE1 family protein [Abortiporus biennis]
MSTTITSLLNSLHTHLQSQTQLLPTLHAQLGLPPTALTDELSTLQQQLAQCIESQIDTRRKQVDEWMQKCADVEEECIRYTKALGGHMKSTGSSVGELRKEQVLPKRFELITDYQEKLRQLYHSKLEQLLTLTNRLNALSRTLGSTYYSSDILEPTPASGESTMEPTFYRDVTPERFNKLEKELVRGKGEMSKRLSQLSATMVQIDWLYTELGMAPPSLDDLPSTSTLSISHTRPPSSCSSRTSSSTSSDPFLSSSINVMTTPTPESRLKTSLTPFLLMTSKSSEEPSQPAPVPESEYERIFARFVARMEELSDEDLSDSAVPTMGLEGVEPTPGLISWADSKRLQLEDIKKRREAHIQAMYDQLEALWRRLGVPDEEMDSFVEAQRGSTEETVRAYEEELDRMLELKRERMSTFVENARAEIVKLWDELMVGEEERADFAPFADDEHTEELLCIHEEEIRRLKEERKLKGTLLTSIRKYFDIVEDQKELAAAAQDQSRLLGRGPRDPGRLLREEKMRKRVSKEKPRLEQDLLNSIPSWETETGRTFMVNGESILRILMDAVGINDQENGNAPPAAKRSKSRSGSVPPRSTTPSNPIHHYVPTSNHGGGSKAVTPAVRPGSSSGTNSKSVPNKRAKLGEATSSFNNSTNHQTLGRSQSKGKAPSSGSSLPRPTGSNIPSIVMPVPTKPGPGSSLGYGRLPSSSHHSHSYHPYPQSQRSTSHSTNSSHSSSFGASQIRVYGSMGFVAATSNVGRKASRARRESFRPRPSIDGNGGGTDRRWPGFAGGVVAEEEGEF